MVLPNKVIIGIGDSVTELKNHIACSDIPTIDVDVLIDFIIDAISTNLNIDDLPNALIKNEVFGSKLDNKQIIELLPISTCAVNSAREISQCLKESGLLTNRCLDFEYHGIINEHTLLLRRRR